MHGVCVPFGRAANLRRNGATCEALLGFPSATFGLVARSAKEDLDEFATELWGEAGSEAGAPLMTFSIALAAAARRPE